ncbi:Structure-specific endonuclease subunit Slx1 [Kalmanozyma brasiliensis GHG001]|uniref:Structure-specific endonuclease subunit Slx1 n=1 Tax=Kalmanozyma brasiliensis (strain GHG001) TaxID=1365824 RepID=UPI002867C89E|nr:Structure-specific endonuclease subunit Slx1 [Kalmanozyma brasiliensis GHG001]KAF6767154.1 Structure-specific endonuclease subunit Slx1 [Kalmanozyma brasiliensis GHG001]
MPSSVTKHTIPSFYACYFLRSLASPGITYIGSTPAPPRRKRQHNGDLTQGAHKTARARPWEMDCIVYGFPSKIAALQFEWAWGKPNLSRHLKFLHTEHSFDGAISDTSAWAGKPLFPSTSMTPGQTRWGKPKRRIARPPSTPNARLLTMRALLRSEPFCGWGLKLAFFTEWSWLAYQRLEAANAASMVEPASSTLELNRHSRSGKALPPLYPLAVCDFAGVDGKRMPLVHVSAQHRTDAGVADQPVKKRQSSSKKKVDVDEPPQWPETLPRSANLKGLDACVQDFDTFPSPQAAATNTDLTRKAKRATKANKEAAAAGEDEEGASEAEDGDLNGGVAAAVEPGSVSTRPLHRMKFDDLDLEESEWKRYEHVIATRLGSASTSAAHAMSEFMQDCVKRYVAAQDARTKETATAAPTTSCALCNHAVDLTRQLNFVLCPSPHASTLPAVSSTIPNTVKSVDSPCNSIFHLSCLADSSLQQQSGGEEINSSVNTVLPTHGVCPSHTSAPKPVGSWADVVRAMYRRHERFERLLQFLVRSGKTLAEHLNPPPPVEIGSPNKGKRKGKSAAAAVDAQGEETETAAPQIPSKPARARKRSQPTALEAVPTMSVETMADEVVPKKVTKRKVSKKVKGVNSTEIIDLT